MLFEHVTTLMHSGVASGGYRSELQAFRRAWGRQTQRAWPQQPSGDVRAVAVRLANKYAGVGAGRYTFSTGKTCLRSQCRPLVRDFKLRVWTRDVWQLSWLCDKDALCAGFGSNGQLYQDVGQLVDDAAFSFALKEHVGQS
jgi:hypothetical protein